MRSCAQWRRRPAPANATMADRLMWNSSSRTSSGCSGGGRLDLDFLGQTAIEAIRPSKVWLEKLGFPWILSSEMSLFKWLQKNFRRNFFEGLLRCGKARQIPFRGQKYTHKT